MAKGTLGAGHRELQDPVSQDGLSDCAVQKGSELREPGYKGQGGFTLASSDLGLLLSLFGPCPVSLLCDLTGLTCSPFPAFPFLPSGLFCPALSLLPPSKVWSTVGGERESVLPRGGLHKTLGRKHVSH